MHEYNLIQDFKEGNEKAFEVVFKMYYQRLLGLAIKMTGSKTEAEDIILPIFQSLFSKPKKFNNLNAIWAFLHVSVKNRCLNFNKLKESSVRRDRRFLDSIEEDPYSHWDILVKEELVKAIYRLINELPTECKRVFMMLIFEEMEPWEVAQKLNITTSTVYNQRSRAIMYFKSKLLKK